MDRRCKGCGGILTTQTMSILYCSPRCKARAAKQRNKDKARLAKEQRFRRKYGITHAEALQLHETQHGRCALCKKRIPPLDLRKTKQTQLDRCPETNRIRGLICRPCKKKLPIILQYVFQFYPQNISE